MARAFGTPGNAIHRTAQLQETHLQTLLDAVELFCGCTGHEIKTKKSHVLLLMWLSDETQGAIECQTSLNKVLTLRRWKTSHIRWTPCRGNIEYFPIAMASEEKRHLGHFQDGYGSSKVALKTLTRDILGKAGRIARSRALTNPAQYLCRAVLYSSAAYKLRFINISTEDIDVVETGVKKLMRRTSSVHMSVPDLLKYGTRGGMKWERWRDKVNIERVWVI